MSKISNRRFLMMFGGGIPLDSSTKAYLKAGEAKGYTLPSKTQIAHMDAYIISLKENDVWNNIARLNFYKNNGSKEMALLDVKDPTLEEQVSGAVWDSAYGIQTAGSAGTTIDTKWKYDDTGIVVLPRHHIAWYQEPTDAYDPGNIYGLRNDDTRYQFRLRKSSTTQVVANQFSSFTDSNSGSLEWRGSNIHEGSTGGSTSAFRWYNKVGGTIISANRPATTQLATPHYSLRVGGINDKGVVSGDYIGKFAGFQIGSYMGTTKRVWLLTAQDNFYKDIII